MKVRMWKAGGTWEPDQALYRIFSNVDTFVSNGRRLRMEAADGGFLGMKEAVAYEVDLSVVGRIEIDNEGAAP